MTVNEEIYYRNTLGGDFGLLPGTSKSDSFIIGGIQSTVTLTSVPSANAPSFVFKNNKLLRYTTDYTIVGTTVTFVASLAMSDFVVVMYNV